MEICDLKTLANDNTKYTSKKNKYIDVPQHTILGFKGPKLHQNTKKKGNKKTILFCINKMALGFNRLFLWTNIYVNRFKDRMVYDEN